MSPDIHADNDMNYETHPVHQSFSGIVQVLIFVQFLYQRQHNPILLDFGFKTKMAWMFCLLRPYFFIAVKIVQVAKPIWIALAGQFRQSGQQ